MINIDHKCLFIQPTKNLEESNAQKLVLEKNLLYKNQNRFLKTNFKQFGQFFLKKRFI